ncbi:MAG: hypothetical protein QNJ63_23550 [Calothrix sp. MO_192.B10]|nr:hypothetical protein [Calothrix sp. MO_192.B10]
MLNQYLRKFAIAPISLLFWIAMGTLINTTAQALPGRTTEDVAAWIKSHPTLRPRVGEKFLVRKSDTAAQRFTFQASVLPPGKITFTRDRSTIRSQRIAMYDAINGMSLERLQESLRVIYGLDIYQDFQQARVIYNYPNQSAINSARFAKTPIREALRGELRMGNRYAYWVEVAKPNQGKAFTGQMTVLLKQDVDKLESELRNR